MDDAEAEQYPILVDDFGLAQSLLIVCEACAAEAVLTADELSNDACYSCPAGCPGWAVYKYEVADRCKGCGQLGFYEAVLDGCCSRRCLLQWQYLQTLRAAG